VRVHIVLSSLVIAAALMFAAPVSHAQKACPPAPTAAAQQSANIFNAQQEMDLGDVEAEWLQRQYGIIDDPAVTAYLQQIGDRLVSHLPDNSVKYKFVIYEQPSANAFGTSGGRIYVSRKLIAFMKSEDELAGVLGHEIGHMVVHQGARDMTAYFQKVLGVTSVSDRQDIFDKLNDFLDNAAKKPGVFANTNGREEPNQLVADRVGMYLVSAAGYDPQALMQFWDRFAGTKGKSGSALSFFFGFSSPDQHRLLEMRNEVASLPGPCGETRPPANPADFTAWQNAVLNYHGIGRKESLHGVLSKAELTPPLRGDIRYLRFSPDGQYAFAQDDSSIYLLSRQPFQFYFRIDAPDAYPAQFSADSQTISFYTRGLRVETWSVPDKSRLELHEVVLHRVCLQTELSPDGKYLACDEMEPTVRVSTPQVGGVFDPRLVNYQPTIDVSVFDVATDAPVWEKKTVAQPNLNVLGYVLLSFRDEGLDLRSRVDTMRFSPDGRYFVISSIDGEAIAYDMSAEKQVSLSGNAKKYLSREFVFIGSDRVAGINAAHANESGIIKFPSGEVVEDLTLGIQNLATPGHGNYLLLRPIDKYPVGVMDLDSKRIFMADTQEAFDIYDKTAIVTHLSGQVSLKDVTTKQDGATLTLPRGPLAPLRAIAVSDDFNWIALSERSHGGIWDLAKNQRPFYVRGFQGAYFAPDGLMYADFPKSAEGDRAMGTFNVAAHSASPKYKIEDRTVRQVGAILLVTKANRKDNSLREDITIEVRDAVTGRSLWTRAFADEAPILQVAPDYSTIVARWLFSTTAAKNELKNNAAVAGRVQYQGGKETDTNFLVEVLDAKTGKLMNALALDTNNRSFVPQSAFAMGDRLVTADNLNRVALYSLSSGKQVAKVFGRAPSVSLASSLLAADNERGQINLFDLTTMEKRDELQFPSPISMKQFSSDGKKLFVLTTSQVAYVLDVSQAMKGTTAAAATQK